MDTNSTFINEDDLQILILNRSHIVRVGMASMIKKRFSNTKIFLADSYFSLVRSLNSKHINILICEALESLEKTSAFAFKIKNIKPDIKLLLLSNRKQSNEFTHTTYKNIDYFLNYNSNENDFFSALSSLKENKRYVKLNLAQNCNSTSQVESYYYKVNDLSSRELEVAQLYISGDGNLEISQRLNLSPSTVSTYKKRIFDKLGVSNVMSLAQLFETKTI